MRLLKKLAHALAFGSKVSKVRPDPPERNDDRVDLVIKFLDQHPDRKHVVACRHRSTITMLQQRYQGMGDIEFWSYHRLLAGIIFRENRMALSATFTIPSEPIYRQLTARLRGEDPLYFVVLDPREKLSYRDYVPPAPWA